MATDTRRVERDQEVFHWHVTYFDDNPVPHIAVACNFGWLYLPEWAFLAIADEYREEHE